MLSGEAANSEIKIYASFLINSSPRKNFPKWISNSGCSLLFPKVDQQLQAQLMKH
jgi:hypothetical protein